MNSLLPLSAGPLERTAEAVVADRLEAVPVPLRTLGDPLACPPAFLAFLAWENSVDRWSVEWTEDVQRSVLAAWVYAHRRKGTRAAIAAVVAALGHAPTVIRRLDEPTLTPAELLAAPALGVFEFRLIVALGTDGITAEGHRALLHIVEATKSKRDHIVEVAVELPPAIAPLHIAAAVYSGSTTTLVASYP